MKNNFLFISIITLLISCGNAPTSNRTQDGEVLDINWKVVSVSSSPLRGIDGIVHWKSDDNHIYAKKTAVTIKPPSDVQLSDIPDDHGHKLKLIWTLSPSENEDLVAWYRIYRSRSQALTEPIPLNQISSLDSLISFEEHYTILVDSVSAGLTDYEDFVPLNGEVYYYWLQAVGAEEEPSVMGTVTNQDNNPIEGTLLRLYNADESIDMNAVSHSDGSYVFYDVPPGEYFLVAKRDDYQLFSTTVTVEK